MDCFSDIFGNFLAVLIAHEGERDFKIKPSTSSKLSMKLSEKSYISFPISRLVDG